MTIFLRVWRSQCTCKDIYLDKLKCHWPVKILRLSRRPDCMTVNNFIAGLAFGLGPIHGLVGVATHVFRPRVILPTECDAKTASNSFLTGGYIVSIDIA